MWPDGAGRQLEISPSIQRSVWLDSMLARISLTRARTVQMRGTAAGTTAFNFFGGGAGGGSIAKSRPSCGTAADFDALVRVPLGTRPRGGWRFCFVGDSASE